MKSNIKIVISLFLIISVISLDPPVWPEQFQQEFHETFNYGIIAPTTKGKIYYDWNNKVYRLDRDNGHWDRYCGPIYPFSDTPCNQYVQKGLRYLDYPDKGYCCMCCTSENGCGLLRPNWLEGANFEGYVEEDGVSYEKWDKSGLQHNYYYATKDTRIMRRIDQQPNDLQDFDVNSFSDKVDPAVFNLPERCSAQNTCPLLSICTFLR
jgi:hypothetical protein